MKNEKRRKEKQDDSLDLDHIPRRCVELKKENLS